MTQVLPQTGDLAVETPLPRTSARWQRRYCSIIAVCDTIACLLPLVLSTLLLSDDRTTDGPGRWVILAAVPTWIFLLGLGRAYDEGFVGVGSEEFRRVANSGIRLLAITAVIGFGFKLAIPRSLVAITIPLTILLSVGLRILGRRLLLRARMRGRAQHGVVVVGRPDSAIPLVERLQMMPEQAFRIAKVCAADNVTIDEVLQAIRDGEADTVAIANDSGLSAEDLKRLGWELEGTHVDLMVSTDLIEVAGPRIHVRPMAGLPLLHVEQPELRGMRRVMKASYDWVLALLALIVLSPVLLMIGIAVRLTSKGPALFKQVRVGRHGELFTVMKFRTMRVGAHDELPGLAAMNEADGPLFKMKVDPRVTPLGRIMRRYSIDEVPQLWNVVTGKMSLVGPRPPIPEEVEQYGPDAGRRLLVKPGLTGLWQVSGRSDLSWDQTIRLDLSYVENWSPALDALILLKTIGAVFRRTGAY